MLANSTGQDETPQAEVSDQGLCCFTPFTQIPRAPSNTGCFTNVGVNSNSARIHKVRKPAI